MIYNLIAAAIFVAIGIVMMFGSDKFFVEYINTIPPKDKKLVDGRAVRRFVVWLMFFVSSCLLVPYSIFILTGRDYSGWGWAVLLISALIAIVYTGRPSTFLKKIKK